ncbi:phosphatidylserine/phosphatidylglycerophosphate/cardiolipin synthase-like enzyme [Halarchaeum rubridurum]|nr:phospholipase D-like domain-containing protein [Halarchaeum rubridurum]MBP1953261.1 phosphatidylserine/phosphatidylglycerophosphate/cardiolipin synthase-like enzyme [Halarchaeum rubridurum]
MEPSTVAPASAPGPATGTPRVVALYPNPVRQEDAGEFVTLAFPDETPLGRCALADDEGSVRLPDVTVRGRVTLSTAPNRTRALVDGRVIESELPSLANAGERLVLVCDGQVVDAASYADAPEGEVYARGVWRSPGRTAFDVRSVTDAPTTVFALPDAPGVVTDTLEAAERRVLLGGYTFTSARVAAALRDAAARGVRVRVLVEGGPVGGVSAREAALLDSLAATPNVTVTVIDGPHARYPFHHAKYAVVDDAALVTSENWDPSGVGGRATRGWGAVVRDPALADALAAVHRADSGWLDGVGWDAYRSNATFQPPSTANGTYPAAFPALSTSAERVSLVVSPDTSKRALVGFVENATETLAVEQMDFDPDTALWNATLAAAERGVRVRVLLSSAWYAREENAARAARLNERARRDGLDLRAKLVDPRGRYGHLHVKGAIADGARVLVGSVNWNANAVNANRETDLVIADPEIGRYYARLFRADWRGGVWTLPVGLALAALCGLCGACLYLRREISFAAVDAGTDGDDSGTETLGWRGEEWE